MPAESVYFTATIGECTEFILDGKKQRVSVVISPLKVYSEEETVKVNSGCNLWKACQNKQCQFSIASHPKKAPEKAKV
jgi:hypothetical protein